MGYILAIDQGTTGTTAIIVEESSFDLVSKFNTEFPQVFPSPGRVEHDLDDIWSTVETSVKEALSLANINGDDISAIGITNQRETICAFNKNGDALHNAIVWQDRRTGALCEQLKGEGLEDYIKKKTGLPIDPYFSGTKINWLLENSEDVRDAFSNNDLLFGNIDTYLLYKLSGCKSFYTEATNASRTLLYDFSKNCWDKKICERLSISTENLPTILNSFDSFGVTKGLNFLPDGLPISGILGDQQSALFGQAGRLEGDLKCTYGTGAFILLNTGNKPYYSENGLITTVAYRKDGVNTFALEGSSYIAGAAVQWLRDNLNIIDSAPEVELLAAQVKNLDEMEHVLFLPFFTGIGSPYWVSDAKAAIIGLTRDTNKAHIALACLDGICLSIEDLIRSMRNDSNLEIRSLKVDGGAVANDLLMEIQATISDLEIIKPTIIETTAYGACLAAAVGIGILKMEDIDKFWKKDRSFNLSEHKRPHYEAKKVQWNKAIERIFL